MEIQSESANIWEEIQKMVYKGKTVEVKKVNGKIVIVEVYRKVKIRTSTTG